VPADETQKECQLVTVYSRLRFCNEYLLQIRITHTCTAEAGDVVTDKTSPADSPQRERVVWSRSQAVHSDLAHRTGNVSAVTDKSVVSRRLDLVPAKCQRVSRRAGETMTLSTKSWRWTQCREIYFLLEISTEIHATDWKTAFYGTNRCSATCIKKTRRRAKKLST